MQNGRGQEWPKLFFSSVGLRCLSTRLVAGERCGSPFKLSVRSVTLAPAASRQPTPAAAAAGDFSATCQQQRSIANATRDPSLASCLF